MAFFLLTCCSFAMAAFSQSSPISGIVNSYTPVTGFGNGCPNSLTAGDVSAFSVDDRILLVQMKGAQIDQNNTLFFGNITAINEAGNYEFGTISSIDGNVVSLVNNLMNDYNIDGLVQLVRVPQYVNATVIDDLTCLPWNGSVGGVLAIEISNELTLEAPIVADGTGFRGGDVSANPEVSIQCSTTGYSFPNNPSLGAPKGEGIAILPEDMMTGRGSLANGGGGGNDHNSGGGGGANATSGGVGGNEWSGCDSFAIGGIGGRPLSFPSKLFLGGGGGGGHQNNDLGTPGTSGGGIVIIRANTLTSNNFPISNNGNELFVEAANDGGGGGGAGGTTILDVANYSGTLFVSANGGGGANVNNGLTMGQCHGTGGGGSGGLIGVTDPLFPVSVIPAIAGGAAGLNVNPQSDCEGTSYGASPGQDGITATSLVLNESSEIADTSEVDLGPDQTLCQGQSIVLDPALNISGIWQDGSVQETYTVSEPGIYSVFIQEACGNQRDTIEIIPSETVELDLPQSYPLCPESNLETGVPDNPNLEYEWSSGETTSLIFVSEPGEYTLTATLDDGFCNNSAEAATVVQAVELPELILNGSMFLCEGEAAVLTAGGDPGTFLWNTGDQGSSLSISSAGIYTVTLTNAQGCSNSDSIVVTNLNNPEVSIEGPTSICESGKVVLTATGNQGDLLWDDGSSETERVITQPGTYNITVTGGNGCTAEASTEIGLLELPSVIVEDAEFCTTENVRLTAVSPNSNLSWPGFSDGSTILVDKGGVYEVLGENICGSTVRRITITEVNCCRAYVPNAFTPDGDGLNDLFAPQISCDPINYSLRIFNRWGELVFESIDIDKKWNGSSLQDGVHYSGLGLYVYEVSYDDPFDPLEETVTLRGSVMLVR